MKPIKDITNNNTDISTLKVPSKNVEIIHNSVIVNKSFFLPSELSDFFPTQGPRIATIIIADDVARPNCWSVHPFSLTNHTEKYKPGIMNA